MRQKKQGSYIAYIVATTRIFAAISELSVFGCAGSVSLVLLAGVDAAWSGDWSRIGAISKDTELLLQSALTAAGVWHLLMGFSAYTIASQNGRPKLPVTAKVMACLVSLVLILCFWDAHGMSQSTSVPNLTLVFVFRLLQLVLFQFWSSCWRSNLKTDFCSGQAYIALYQVRVQSRMIWLVHKNAASNIMVCPL